MTDREMLRTIYEQVTGYGTEGNLSLKEAINIILVRLDRQNDWVLALDQLFQNKYDELSDMYDLQESRVGTLEERMDEAA